MPASFDHSQGIRPPPNAPRKQTYNANTGGSRIHSMNAANEIGPPSASGSSIIPGMNSINDTAASLFGGEMSGGPSILEGDHSINGSSNVQEIGTTASWLSRRMLPPSDFDHPMTAYADTPTGRNTSGSNISTHRDGHNASASTAAAFQTPSMARPPTSSLYEQLARGMAASRKQNSNVRTSLASSSGWGSPRTIAPSTSHFGSNRLFSGESSGFAAGPSRLGARMPAESNIFNTPNHSNPSAIQNRPSIPLPRFSFPKNSITTPYVATRGINQDGSHNVVRDEDDANNSGLLPLSPAVRGPVANLGMSAIFPRISKGSNASSSIASVSAERSKAISNPSDQQSNATMIEHGLEVESYEGEDEESNRRQSHFLQSGLRGQGIRGDGIEAGQNTSALLDIMRNWREDAMKHHLYDTAIFWGDKILSLETEQIAWNDAYNLATAYFLTHRYAQAEHLLCTPLRLARTADDDGNAEENGMDGEDNEDEQRSIGVDNDELGEAIAATHRNSKLPSAMLAKAYASRPVLNGHSSSESYEGNEEAPHFLDRKRKDRTFTISGTGTASEGGTSAAGSVQGDMNNGEIEEDKGEYATEEKIAEAWREEQKLAMEEVRQTESAPPDGISLVSVSIPCRYLAAQCMARQGKYQEALDELSGWKGDRMDLLEQSYKQPSRDGLIKLSSSIWHLKGLIQLHLRNTEEARESFMRSLSLDIKNYESFDQLVRGHLLTASQQWAFVENLEYVAQAGGDPAQLEALNVVKLLYTTLLDKNGKEHAQQAAASRRQLIGLYGLGNSPDVLLGLAEEMFSRMRYEDAYTVTQRIMDLSKDHETALPVHISSMYMSERLRPALYLLAHHLTDTDPDMAAGWYAVGCWYFSTQRWLEARKYFSKSVQLDPRFAPGWIAFAHTFAFEGESDQAIISYSTAERNFSAHYLIKLFLGMEHLSQGNLTLAELYLTGSAEVWEEDALSRNERGVVAYYGGRLEEAIELFRSALEAAKDVQQPAKEWLTTHLNLAFALRRTGQLSDARQSFLKVLELDPDMAIAYTGVGMCLHGEGDLEEAISWYHRSLAIDPIDKYANDLLSFALQESAQQMPEKLLAAADRFVIENENQRFLSAAVQDKDDENVKDAFGIKIESGDQTALIQNQSSTMDEGTREMTLAEGSMSAEMDESY